MKLIFKSVDTLTENEIQLWSTKFDKNRTDLVNKKRPNDRRLSICGDLLILKVAKECGTDDKFSVLRNHHGKPYFADKNIHFNVSHKGNLAICAYGQYNVGIDIENVKPFDPRLAKKVCCDDELLYIGNDTVRFAEIWTAKEAYIKYIGDGISIGLKNAKVNTAKHTVNGVPYSFNLQDHYVYSIVSDEV